ncbi:MAG: hypothetical protein AB1571_00655 [Nanoarchaeota archaeon]
MKRLFIFLMVTLLANIALAMDISVSMVPVGDIMPGNYFNVQFNVVNGGSQLNNVSFEIDEGSSFSVKGDRKINYNLLMPYQTVTLNYNLKADSDAKTGYKAISLKASTSNDSSEKTFNVYVSGIESTLSISSVKSEPEKLVPGESSSVKINVRNKASYSLKNVNLKLDFSNSPFAPINSVGEKNIDEISDESSEEVTFTIITLADAKTGVYKVPLFITYFDEFGRAYNESSIISLIVGAEPNLEISIEENKLVVERPSTISLKLINNGLSDVKFLSIRLEPGDYEILSNENLYIGNIDSDDYENIEFKLNPKNQNIVIPLTLIFKDANNEDYTKTAFVSARVYSASEAKAMGLIQSNNRLYIIFGVIFVFAIYLFYRRIKKKRKSNA